MQLIEDNSKIRRNQTGKLITDLTLDFFNERLNVQFLNKKFGKHFQKQKLCSIDGTFVRRMRKDVRYYFGKNHDERWCRNQNSLFDLLFAVVVRN